MAKQIGEEDLAAILAAVGGHPGGAHREEIARALPRKMAPRTLQFWLKHLVESGRFRTTGVKRSVRYHLPAVAAVAESVTPRETPEAISAIPLSRAGAEIQRYVGRPLEARKPVGYNHGFLDGYRPNVSFYLSAEERARLAATADRTASCD